MRSHTGKTTTCIKLRQVERLSTVNLFKVACESFRQYSCFFYGPVAQSVRASDSGRTPQGRYSIIIEIRVRFLFSPLSQKFGK